MTTTNPAPLADSTMPQEKGRIGPEVVARSLNMKRWALLVGVSGYKDPSLRLRYARRDVEELWKLLQTNACGAFVPERTKVLVDADATTTAVTSALRSFLKHAAPDDLVLIYFSGHGAEDPNSKNKIHYLLTYDTDPNDLASTALPMREIMQSIDDYVKAKRIVMMMDTCHSAAVEGGRGSGGEPLTLERYQTEQQKAQEGFAIFTSSEAKELSREHENYGGGHGLFTHLILEGLRGKADKNQNGTVTLGELVDYVVEQTRILGGESAQHPRVGSKQFDRDLVLAVTGGMQARERLDVGVQMVQMAIELQDARRFEAAARHLLSAEELARLEGGLPEARKWAGIALLGAGQVDRACEELQRVVEIDEKERLAGQVGFPDAHYFLGAALAIKGERDKAAQALETFAKRNPTHARHSWAMLAAKWLREPVATMKGEDLHGLLIGVGRYQGNGGPKQKLLKQKLLGPTHDVDRMRDVLCNVFDAKKENIATRIDKGATLDGLRKAFDHLRETTKPEQTVVVFFSGHATERDEDDVYLLPHDALRDGSNELHGMSAAELHDRMNTIPAKSKLLILDTHPKLAFFKLAQKIDTTYSVLVAAGLGQKREVTVEENGKTVSVGLLTYALTDALTKLGSSARWRELLASVRVTVHSRDQQETPQLFGSEHLPFLASRQDYLEVAVLFEMSLIGRHAGMSKQATRVVHQQLVKQLNAPCAELEVALARELLAQEDFEGAVQTLTASSLDPDIAWHLGYAQCQRQLPEEALAHFRAFAASLPNKDEWIQEGERLLTTIKAQRPKALLIGIDQYTSPELYKLSGAAEDARSLRDVLVQHYGFAETDIVMLIDEQATTEAIRREFQKLAMTAREAPALFFFSGMGSSDGRERTILGADARKADVFDVPLTDLRAIVGETPTNLACIFDTGFGEPTHTQEPRFAPVDIRRPSRGDKGFLGGEQFTTELGRACLVNKPGIRITEKLVSLLKANQDEPLSWKRCADKIKGLSAIAEEPDEQVFTNATAQARLQALFVQARRSPWKQTAVALGKLLAEGLLSREEGYVDLGITYALLGDVERAIIALKAAIPPKEKNPEASYHLGRVLVDNDRERGRAQTALEIAAQAYPNDPAVQYYLGAAIRAVLEKESMKRVRSAWTNYLKAGAPLGHREEVEKFLTGPASR